MSAIDDHLDDSRLHIVAAPGAGKTTLGLEVFRRLERRALVLSPTRVIRDQWLLRLKDFVPEEADLSLDNLPDWASNDIRNIQPLTSITYQALHSKLPGKDQKVESEVDIANGAADESIEEAPIDEDAGLEADELDSFVALLMQHDVQLLILDEAHHLRAEWWRAIDAVCNKIPNMVLVALTATPPYDSENLEWQRYQELCGPIDEEISVPELVKAETLCAHQDYIWTVSLDSKESERVLEYDERVSKLCQSLFDDERFRTIVRQHPWVKIDDVKVDSAEVEGAETQSVEAEDVEDSENMLANADDLFKNPELAVAILSYLKAIEDKLPVSLCRALDLGHEEIPELGRQQWQRLVEAIIFTDSFKLEKEATDYVAELKRLLRSTELLHKRELSLVRSRRLDRSISLSVSKIKACLDIHLLENKHRGEFLRQVILTDYIRDEALKSTVDAGEVNLGCWPVYQALCKGSAVPEQIGMLSGRLSILHESRLEAFLQYVTAEKFKITPLTYLEGYVQLSGPLNQLTTAFTALLTAGEIRVLVGTRSLLGEGWDAPCVNSLILASVVGSFMLTNQMRGRAIRLDKNIEHKVSSIWHLLAIDSKSPSGMRDYGELRKRFNTFVGLSEQGATIESGFERLNIDEHWEMLKRDREYDYVTTINTRMRENYGNRESLAGRWKKALTLDSNARVLPSVFTPSLPDIRFYHVKETYKALLIEMTKLLGGVIAMSIYNSRNQGLDFVLMVIGMVCIGTVIYKLPQTIAIIKTFLKHLPVDGSLKQIGYALADALCESGMIKTERELMTVNTVENFDGTVVVSLSGGTFYESSLFADCMAEILGPIDNPRYMLVREGELHGQARDDFHAVPVRFAVKKELAQLFSESWRRYVSPTELIYTRTKEGKQRLLKARMRAFSSVFENKVRREDRWQT
ncbi:superfamily II DNA or RNA helicase [Pseudoteredinibacter isoporae]|uniref:Superfamily II DNA or RNA helicase n=1 Tax=Pseudoteredinibacter isoporae TaxID=570281 RepID=A0A7X0JT85_9GAMM|nr:superfamily II DNA or RNA helicase [Pseudoteredinibacter isoporae]